MTLRSQIHATIYPGDQSGYVAECQEIAIVTQGSTLDEVTSNLREAVELYLEDEDPAEFRFVANPSLVVTFELQPEYA
ncbi:MAG: type II toxin-antitoxin system HicB family antitoxin [Plectolyngbya sp. WJT66-NPBG17]|jgi:predicted RNase H-like HicB family nuclease|nr:type II toxin-antitoxin system HicB family antitoxin [Plectolyngbya sp. WJT66-NPBG17]